MHAARAVFGEVFWGGCCFLLCSAHSRAQECPPSLQRKSPLHTQHDGAWPQQVLRHRKDGILFQEAVMDGEGAGPPFIRGPLGITTSQEHRIFQVLHPNPMPAFIYICGFMSKVTVQAAGFAACSGIILKTVYRTQFAQAIIVSE